MNMHPDLFVGGPTPIGGRKANLSSEILQWVEEVNGLGPLCRAGWGVLLRPNSSTNGADQRRHCPARLVRSWGFVRHEC